jgi:hypothetical protein
MEGKNLRSDRSESHTKPSPYVVGTWYYHSVTKINIMFLELPNKANNNKYLVYYASHDGLDPHSSWFPRRDVEGSEFGEWLIR